MNYVSMPGFGDPATWGGRSPCTNDYEGPVFFPMTIGLAGARVIVNAQTNGYELEDIDSVMYEGIDIFPALDSCTHIDIRNHYERNAQAINQAATAPQEP